MIVLWYVAFSHFFFFLPTLKLTARRMTRGMPYADAYYGANASTLCLTPTSLRYANISFSMTLCLHLFDIHQPSASALYSWRDDSQPPPVAASGPLGAGVAGISRVRYQISRILVNQRQNAARSHLARSRAACLMYATL